MPKQFIKFFYNEETQKTESLFDKTLKRNRQICDSIFLVANKEQLGIIKAELGQTLIGKILVEPIGRNTAPAIALACMCLPSDEIVLVTPSDHLIKNEKVYDDVIKRAKELATNGNLVTFGINPLYPEIGYGYIESNGEDVVSFREKPSLEKAKEYIQQGNYYWNSGIFCFKAGIFLEELKKYAPTIYEKSLIAFEAKEIVQDTIYINEEKMSAIPEDSIDYAVMEKSSLVKVVFADMEWSDLGSFESLYNELPKDNNNNTCCSAHISVNAHNNFIATSSQKPIITIDVDDLIIVESSKAVFVSKKGSSGKVKEIMGFLKTNGLY